MGKKARGKHRLDKYYHLAKEQGYRARSAFKLVQLNRKFGFLNQSRSLLDLCAAPGGWLQVAVKTMPVASQILGVDLVPIRPIRGVKTFVEDITTQKCRQTLKKEMKGGLCDVVIHDGAPNVGGAWSSEAYSQSSLVVDALRLASEFLKPNGVFVTKIFRSKDYHALLYAFQQLFDKVDSTKPSASRHASAEIFTVCRGFKAAAKIDPRLLDPRHLFQDVADTPAVMGPDALLRQQQKKGRHRSGYEDGMSSSHRPASALSFVLSERPVEMLGTVTALVLDGGASQQLPQAAAEHSVADAVRSAALIRDHQSTDREIRTLCSDLQVLGRSEFKQLLKWRMALRKELLETGKPKQDGSGRQASEEAAAGQEADEASKAEAESAALLKEMEEVKARIEARQKRDRRRRRELRKKGKLRSAQLAQQEGIGEEAHPDDEALFTLSAMKSKAALDRVDAVGAAAGDELGSELDSGSEDEAAGAAEDASDGEDDDLRYEALVEEYLDTCYQAYLEKQGRKKQVERKKRKRLGMDDLPEGEDGDAALPVAEPPSDDEDDADGGLIVDLDQAPRPTEAAVAKQWFSQGLFQDANLLDDDDDDEEEEIGRDAKAGVAPRGNGAAAENEGLTRAMQQRQQHRADQHSDSESESLEEEELQPGSRRKGAEADRHGDDAGPRTASPGPPKSATLRMGLDKGSDPALRQQGEASGSESEDEGMPDAQGAAGSGAGRSPLTSKGGFEVVPQEVHSDGSGSTDTEDEFDALNDQGKAEVLALAKRMRLSKEKHSIVEQAYNRFAFHDRHLPRWFAEEESKFMRPAPILSQEEVEEQKAALQAVDTRPIKKVAEAKARKRKRAAAKMVKAKARAEAISSQEDVPMKSRMREIEKVYARARSSGNRGSKGRKGDKRKAPPLDRRMKKDARGLKKAAAKKGGKGKGKKSGGVRKR